MSLQSFDNYKENTGRELSGRFVFLVVVGFFSVVFLANGIFVYQAIGTYTGLVANEPYRKGLEYNQRIEAARAQQRLGWQHGLKLEGNTRLVLDLKGKTGPVSGVIPVVTIGRASTQAFDETATLVHEGNGIYAAAITERAPGAWIATLEIRQPGSDGSEQVTYRAKERLWLKP